MDLNRIAPCALALALAACGGSDNNHGGGTSGSTGVSGTVAGLAFTGKEAISAVVPPTTCNVGGVSVSVASLVIGLSNVTGTCSLASNACTAKANAQGLVIALANLSPSAIGQASPIGPGSYPISPISSPSASTHQGFAALGRLDASCNDVANVPDVTGGTVTITAASGTSASGTVSVTFADGSTVSGPFTTTSCAGLQVDPCSGTVSGFGGAAACTGTRTCTP